MTTKAATVSRTSRYGFTTTRPPGEGLDAGVDGDEDRLGDRRDDVEPATPERHAGEVLRLFSWAEPSEL